MQLIIPHPLAFTLLLAFGILSATKIQVPMGYTYFISTVLVPIFLLTVFRNIHLTRHSLRLWMQVISYIAAFVGLYGVVIALLNPFERLGSFWVTAMTINGFYTVAFFFAITLALYHKSRPKTGECICALLILLGMLYTYTPWRSWRCFWDFLLMLPESDALSGIGTMLLMPS